MGGWLVQLNRRKGHTTVYRILLIPLSVLGIGIGTGLLADWLLPGINGAIPGWAMAGLMTVTGLVVDSALREHHYANQHYPLAGELEASKLDLDSVRKKLAGLHDQLDAIPDSRPVIAKIRVLQSLIGQFNEKQEHSRGGQTELSDPPHVNMRLLKRALDREVMDLIVKKIKPEKVFLDTPDYNINFGQRYLFGKPRLRTSDL